MAYVSYSEKLKNPLWQRKRLEILSRDSFTCRFCYDNKSTLHVHHLDYIPGNEPWEYPDEYFLTLCESCHQKATEFRPAFEKLVIKNLRLKLTDNFTQKGLLFILDKISEKDFNDVVYMMWEIVHNNHDLSAIMQEAYSTSVQQEISEKEVING